MICANENTKNLISFSSFSQKCSKLFLSKIAYFILFLLACTIVLTQSEVIGTVIFLLIICLALCLCDDLTTTTLPFLLLCVFVTRCYDSFDVFIKFIPLAAPILFSLIFRYIFYRKKIVIGKSFFGLIVVSTALILGGVGFISPSDYFKPSSLFYIFFLGIGMTIFYIIFKSNLYNIQRYNMKNKIITLFYISGLLSCVIILFIQYLSETKSYLESYILWQPGNNLSTFLLFAIPCPFYFARKNIMHIFSAILFYVCIIVSQSRGGIVMGTILLVICLITYSLEDKKHRITYFFILFLAILSFFIFKNSIFSHFNSDPFSYFIDLDDPRFQMMKRGLGNFYKYPIFGHGLGHTGNIDIYNPVKGAMEWYHMMIPQIVAGLGIIGVFAYGYQFYLRCKITLVSLKNSNGCHRSATITLFLSYLGVLLMSQVNPGLFCPFPYSIMAVMIFTVLEEDPPIKLKIKR